MAVEEFFKNSDDYYARAICAYAFRNGIVEDMHADGKLSQDDMKQLNIWITNKIAGLIQAYKSGRFKDIDKVLLFHARCTLGWDNAIPDMSDFDIAQETEM